MTSHSTPARSHRMTAAELRLSASLAAIFALRMLGLFLILPVFAIEARSYPGGNDPQWVGWIMGAYGLTQFFLQIPMGWASDRWGRKPVVIAGLCLFIVGSVVAALSADLWGLLIGRSLQGAGAISAALTAWVSDGTREIVRTKAMAMIGISIGASFAIALVLAPWAVGFGGLSALFWGISVLGLLALLVVVLTMREPAAAARPLDTRAFIPTLWRQLRAPNLWRLHLGVFVLHAVQLAAWSAVPFLLLQGGLAKTAHWQLYLPALLGSAVVMGGVLFRLERKGFLRAVFLSQIALLVAVQGLWFWLCFDAAPSMFALGTVLFLFFCGFNMLEASQPSLVSRYALPSERGVAMGAYNALQSLGLFVGGALGGWVMSWYGAPALFLLCALLLLVWLLLAWSMPPVVNHGGV